MVYIFFFFLLRWWPVTGQWSSKSTVNMNLVIASAVGLTSSSIYWQNLHKISLISCCSIALFSTFSQCTPVYKYHVFLSQRLLMILLDMCIIHAAYTMYTNGLWNEFNCMHSELAHVFKPIITTSEDKCMQYKFVFIMICGTKNSMDVPLSNTMDLYSGTSPKDHLNIKTTSILRPPRY